MNRKMTVAISALAVAGLSFAGVSVAHADAAPSFVVYDEPDSPNPYSVVDGLVFYKAADLGWVIDKPIAEVTDLDFTVASGTSYAPSFQLITKSDQKSYARLVWEAYQQPGSLDPKAGEYTNLQDGIWWTNKIPSGPGSQSDPQPLSFFHDGGGAGWTNVRVGAVDVHQGTTTDATSVVTNVTVNGDSIPLGTPDATPFDQTAIDAATNPLDAQIDELTNEKAALVAQVAELEAYKGTHSHTDAAYNAKADKLLSFQAKSPLTVSGTLKVGQTLTLSGAKPTGVSSAYQWYVGGVKVTNATNTTFKLPKSAAGHSVSVKITRTYEDSAGVARSVTTTVQPTAKAYVAK